MMLYSCKNCNKEIALSEIDFEGAYFCQCGGMELNWKGTRKDHIPVKKDVLSMIISGVEDHYK